MKRESYSSREKGHGPSRKDFSLFEAEVNYNIARGVVDEMMTVRDSRGAYPVVIALANESISMLLRRIVAIGGRANAFIKNEDESVTYLSIVPDNAARNNLLDLSDKSQWSNGDAEIGLLLNMLRNRYSGVIVPSELRSSEDVLGIEESTANVEFEKAPALSFA